MKQRSTKPLVLGLGVASALALLGACHNNHAEKSDDQRTAAGQVLSGSVSDAMIPYDALTSTPPVAAPTAKAGPAGGADAEGAPAPGDKGASAGDSAAPAGEAPPADVAPANPAAAASPAA